MKKDIFILLVIFPFWGKTQTLNFTFLRVNNEKPCDTCYIETIFNSELPVSYALMDAIDEYKTEESKLYSEIGAGLKNVSKHFTSSGSFTLNFLPRNMPGETDPFSTWPGKKSLYKALQFQVWHDNQVKTDWAAIESLPKDLYSIVYFNQSGSPSRQTSKEWRSFSAGIFNLKVKDSLIVKIRETSSQEIVQTIFIKRIERLPSFFDFVQFPANTDLQTILNIQLNTSSGLIADSINEIEINPGNSGLLRFGTNLDNYTRTIQYAWSNSPDQWHELSKGKTNLTMSPYLFILINQPPEGKNSELLLRYKHQQESIRRIKIKTGKLPSQTSWFKIGASILLALCLFGIWYYFKRRKHKKQLLELNRKKDDIENKLQLLSGQLNPHFLFNSLNAIQGLINKNDVEKANSYVNEVATFMRTVMDTGRKEFISLKEEIEIEENYMQLEQKRRSFQYSIQNKCGRDLSQIEFPPLLLQPVIENSIRHGLSNKIINPAIAIEINCALTDLVITVTDNGAGFDTTVITEGHGLSLIKKRIALLNEKLDQMKIGMQIRSEKGKEVATIFTFKNWLR